jgi:hypothetical protein
MFRIQGSTYEVPEIDSGVETLNWWHDRSRCTRWLKVFIGSSCYKTKAGKCWEAAFNLSGRTLGGIGADVT